MNTYIADIIPRLSNYSKRLDNLTLLADQHWVALNMISHEKCVYIFRRNNELLVSKNGLVERGKWEFIGKDSLLIEVYNISRLFKHGFLDENVLALKVDSKDEYAIFINESKHNRELNSINAVHIFLHEKYFESTTPSAFNPIDVSPNANQEGGLNNTDIHFVLILFIAVLLFLFAIIMGMK